VIPQRPNLPRASSALPETLPEDVAFTALIHGILGFMKAGYWALGKERERVRTDL